MVKLTVNSAIDFDASDYFTVNRRIHDQNDYYYTSAGIQEATLFSSETEAGSRVKSSPLYFGRATLGADWGFDPAGAITGRIGHEKLSEWLAHRDLADDTPESLVARIFVGADHLRGNSGNDVLDGHAGADTLMGREGDDTLIGGVGDDILTGGFGDDVLTGGFGADHFVLRGLHDIVGGGEIITDFRHADGDKIDFSLFDADVETPGDNLIFFIGQNEFGFTGGLPEVRVEVVSDTVNELQFDVDADGKIDAAVTVYTSRAIDASDVRYAGDPGGIPGAAAFGEDTALSAPAHLPHVGHAELATGYLA